MPILLTWEAPASPLIIGYRVYRRQGLGVINTETDFIANVPASPLSYGDSAYDRTVLETVGYTYAITALGPGGEGPISLAQFITVNFDQTIFEEEWDINIDGTEVPQFVEEWEYSLNLTPQELYFEDWSLDIIDMFEYEEGWEASEFTDPGMFEYEELWEVVDFTDPGMFEYDEDWESPAITDPGMLEYDEGWETMSPIEDPGTLEYEEGWEEVPHVGDGNWFIAKDFKADTEPFVPGEVTSFVNHDGDFYAGTSEGYNVGFEGSNNRHGQVWRWNNGNWVLHHSFDAQFAEYVEDLISFGGDLYATVSSGDTNDDSDIFVDTGGGFVLEHSFPFVVGGSAHRPLRFGTFGGELYVCGSESTTITPHATVWKQDSPGIWSKAADIPNGGDTEQRRGICFAEFEGTFYLAVGQPIYGYGTYTELPAQIWESVDGSSWSLSHTFSAPFNAIGDLAIYQGELYASLYENGTDTNNEREIWKFNGTIWSQVAIIGPRTSPSPSSEAEFLTRFLNINDTQFMLAVGAVSFNFDDGDNTWDTGDQRILYTTSGSTWLELVNFGIDNSSVHALAVNTQNDKVYAGSGGSFNTGMQSEYQAKIHVCPSADV